MNWEEILRAAHCHQREADGKEFMLPVTGPRQLPRRARFEDGQVIVERAKP